MSIICLCLLLMGTVAKSAIAQEVYCADINKDGTVDFDDFFILADQFGKPCAGCDSTFTLDSIPNMVIKINSPTDKSTISTGTTVRGTVSNMPSGYIIKVLVRPPGDRWYPQSGVALFPDSTWSATTFVGSENDVGTEFLIGAFAVTENQARCIEEALTKRTQVFINGQLHAVTTVTRR